MKDTLERWDEADILERWDEADILERWVADTLKEGDEADPRYFFTGYRNDHNNHILTYTSIYNVLYETSSDSEI